MAITKKRKLIIFIFVLLIIIIAIITIIIYKTYYPTFYKYNDSWIIGRSYEEIAERYGEFDLEYSVSYNKEGKATGGTGAYEAETPFRRIGRQFLGGQIPYYFIVFDENGIATKVYIRGYPGG
jgi:uncharacterized protein YxeA